MLTLYTEGDENNDPEKRKTPFSNIKMIYSIIVVHLLLLVTIVVIYFTDFSLIMQIGIGILCAIITFYIAQRFIVKHKNFAHLFHLIGAITLFLLMVQTAVELFPNNRLPIAVVVLFNCFGWIVIGYRWKIKYFQIAGICGILLFIGFFLATI